MASISFMPVSRYHFLAIAFDDPVEPVLTTRHLQVQGTCNPDWAPIDWPDKARGQLRTLSIVTLQVYANHKTQAKRAVPGHVLSYDTSASVDGARSLAGVVQDQNRVPQLDGKKGNQEQAVSISTQTVAAEHQQQSATQQPASDALNQEPQLSQPSAANTDHRFVPATRQDSHDSSDSGQDGSTTEANPSLSSQPIPDRSLILTAEVNLDELNVFHQDLASLDVCLPPNTLVLELTEGLCLFPSLDLAGTSSDLAPLADTAAANMPLLPGNSLAQHQSAAAAAADDNMPVQGSMSEQVWLCSLFLHQSCCACTRQRLHERQIHSTSRIA